MIKPSRSLTWIAVFWGIFYLPHLALAQITPDRSLGSERSRLTNRPVHQQPAEVIEGGAVRGANLFHSFTTFNVRRGQRVYFATPDGVENIFSRITGRTRSNIQGTLGVEGGANLFLLNPNGILFGRNAALDLRGSFLATTANSFRFPNALQFSAIYPQPVPLLTISAPIGLQFGQHPGSIVDRSQARSVDPSGALLRDPDRDPATGLRVLPAQTLAFVGGDIQLQGGGLVAGSQPTDPGGRIELGSVAGSGLVNLTPVAQGLSLEYRHISSFGNVRLTQASSVNASGSSGGAIRVQAGRLDVEDGSSIFSVTQGSGSGSALTLNAADHITLTNQAFVLTATQGTGSAAAIRVTTPRLIIRGDGTMLGSSTLSNAQGGDVTVTARDAVAVDNGLLFAQTLCTGLCEKGRSGNLTVTTGQLLIQAGGQVNTTTFGAGQGGNLYVQADAVNLEGIRRDVNDRPVLQRSIPFPSSLFAGAEHGSTGSGGNLRIATQRLSLSGGAVLYAGTFGSGDAGKLTIHAVDSTEISGAAVDANAPTSVAAYSGGLGDGFPSFPDALGAGGTIQLTTGELIVQDGAQVGVSSLNRQAPGAGRITIDAPLIRLNGGILSAQTASGNGARIQVRDVDLLLMQNHSQITTNAGLNGGEGTGGDINVNAQFAVTGAYEDSDITANARLQNAGNVTINANTTGFATRTHLTPFSDVTAFSERGVNGRITIGNPQIDPTQGLTELPANFIDRSTQIAQGCTPRNRDAGRFVITGRGGLPLSPDQALSDRAIVAPDWVTLADAGPALQSDNRPRPSSLPTSEKTAETAIVEASGLSHDANGQLVLVARSQPLDPVPQRGDAACLGSRINF